MSASRLLLLLAVLLLWAGCLTILASEEANPRFRLGGEVEDAYYLGFINSIYALLMARIAAPHFLARFISQTARAVCFSGTLLRDEGQLLIFLLKPWPAALPQRHQAAAARGCTARLSLRLLWTTVVDLSRHFGFTIGQAWRYR